MQKETASITGRIDSIVYRSDETGYVVARALLEDGDDIVVVGTMPFLGVGETITATGEYVNHPQYDLQFKFNSYEIKMPDDMSWEEAVEDAIKCKKTSDK